MRYVLISAAAAMALVGAAALGHAQGPDDKGKGPADQGREAAPEKPQRAPGAEDKERSQRPTPNRAAEPGDKAKPDMERRKGAQRDTDGDRPKAAQQPKDRPQATEQQRSKDQPRTTDVPKSGKKDEPRTTDAPKSGKDQPKSSEQRPKDAAKDQPKSTEAPKQDKDGKDASKSAGEQQGARVQVSEQQRSGVREQLTKTRVEKTRINVSVNIGARVPRSVRLHTLPVAVVGLAPAYRGYSYIVLEDDTICVVDPNTYMIVDVIHTGTQRADRPSRPDLALSTDQMRFIYSSVDRGRRANVRVRLALGAEVPRDVELLAFPERVTERIPDVRRYRYIVSGDDVVIVDPNDNAVALVISD